MFTDQEGFDATLNRYKGNLHSHTVNSDGCHTPMESVAAFRTHGYSFLCLSEHDLYTDYRADFDSEDFILLPGLEASACLYAEEGSEGAGAGTRAGAGTGASASAGGVSAPKPRLLKTHHMLGILGTDEMVAAAPERFEHLERLEPLVRYGSWDGAALAQELADTLHRHGCIATYNHPIWSRVEADEFVGVEGLNGLEIYNYDTVNESATGYDVTYWDLMLRRGIRMNGFASDDNHDHGRFDDAFGGWIVVLAPELTRDAVIRAILAGSYYSSSGPEIRAWGVRDGHVWVECSPCERVTLVAGGCVGAGETIIDTTGAGLRRAEFALRGDETYVRVECVDARGKTAWTNPLYAA